MPFTDLLFCSDTNECDLADKSCGNASCMNTPGSFECHCPPGYEFDDELRVCKGQSRNCNFRRERRGWCTSRIFCSNLWWNEWLCSSFRPLYWSLRNVAFIVIRVRAIVCHSLGRRIDNHARYSLLVEFGWARATKWSRDQRFSIVPTDVDECKSRKNACDQVCTNTEGSFSCSCHAGYILSNDSKSCQGKLPS